MTSHFVEYVTKVLKDNGIPENQDFTTSSEDFGILKWESGTMYEDAGGRLCASDITWILEESDIKPIGNSKITNCSGCSKCLCGSADQM